MRAKKLNVKERKEIFQTLVSVQDQGTMSTADAETHVSKLFKIDENQLKQIVEEGIDKDWLDESVAVA